MAQSHANERSVERVRSRTMVRRLAARISCAPHQIRAAEMAMTMKGKGRLNQ